MLGPVPWQFDVAHPLGRWGREHLPGGTICRRVYERFSVVGNDHSVQHPSSQALWFAAMSRDWTPQQVDKLVKQSRLVAVPRSVRSGLDEELSGESIGRAHESAVGRVDADVRFQVGEDAWRRYQSWRTKRERSRRNAGWAHSGVEPMELSAVRRVLCERYRTDHGWSAGVLPDWESERMGTAVGHLVDDWLTREILDDLDRELDGRRREDHRREFGEVAS